MEVIIKRMGIKQIFYHIVILFITCVLSMLIHGCGCSYQVMEGEVASPPPPAVKEADKAEKLEKAEEAKKKEAPKPSAAADKPAKVEKAEKTEKVEKKVKAKVFKGEVVKAEPPVTARETPIIIKLTCRKYLLNEQDEEPGYGLYSYVLLSEEAEKNSQTEKRYIEFFKAYYLGIVKYRQEDRLISKHSLNITYWPLVLSASKKIPTTEKGNEKFFVDNYNYYTGRKIMGNIRYLEGRGPFLISYRTPLRELLGKPCKEDLLIINFTGVHEKYFRDVFNHFQKKVADDPNTWANKFDLALIRIKIRSELEGSSMPIIKVAQWVGNTFGLLPKPAHAEEGK